MDECSVKYYAYEYSVLNKLLENLRIKSIDINSESIDINSMTHNEKGLLENRNVGSYKLLREINLIFDNRYCFIFNSKKIKDWFEQGLNSEYAARCLESEIAKDFLKKVVYKEKD